MEDIEQIKMYEHAYALLEEGELEEALEQARLLLAKDDDNYHFWCLEGQVRLALGEEQPAERAFDRACELAPGHPEPLFHKANYHLVLEEFEEAYRLGEKALEFGETEEDRINAHILLGEAQFGHSQSLIMEWLEDMVEMEGEAGLASGAEIEIPPLPPEILALLEKGLRATEKAIEINDEIPEAWDLKARYGLIMDDVSSAIEAWKKAIEIEPYEPLFWHNLGITYNDLEDVEMAEKAFRKVFELEQENPEGMEFSREEFLEVASQACQDLEAEVHEMLEAPVVFAVSTEDFPTEEYLDNAPPQYPFDPWIPCVVAAGPPSEALDTIEFILFQRNVEREVGIDDPEALYQYLGDLLRELLMQVFESLEEGEQIEA